MKNQITNRNSSQLRRLMKTDADKGKTNIDHLKNWALNRMTNFSDNLNDSGKQQLYHIILAVNFLLRKDARCNEYDTPLNHSSLRDALREISPKDKNNASKISDGELDKLALDIEILATHSHESDALSKLPKRLQQLVTHLGVEQLNLTNDESREIVKDIRFSRNDETFMFGGDTRTMAAKLKPIQNQIKFLMEDQTSKWFQQKDSEIKDLQKVNQDIKNKYKQEQSQNEKLKTEFNILSDLKNKVDKEIEEVKHDIEDQKELAIQFSLESVGLTYSLNNLKELYIKSSGSEVEVDKITIDEMKKYFESNIKVTQENQENINKYTNELNGIAKQLGVLENFERLSLEQKFIRVTRKIDKLQKSAEQSATKEDERPTDTSNNNLSEHQQPTNTMKNESLSHAKFTSNEQKRSNEQSMNRHVEDNPLKSRGIKLEYKEILSPSNAKIESSVEPKGIQQITTANEITQPTITVTTAQVQALRESMINDFKEVNNQTKMKRDSNFLPACFDFVSAELEDEEKFKQQISLSNKNLSKRASAVRFILDMVIKGNKNYATIHNLNATFLTCSSNNITDITSLLKMKPIVPFLELLINDDEASFPLPLAKCFCTFYGINFDDYFDFKNGFYELKNKETKVELPEGSGSFFSCLMALHSMNPMLFNNKIAIPKIQHRNKQ